MLIYADLKEGDMLIHSKFALSLFVLSVKHIKNGNIIVTWVAPSSGHINVDPTVREDSALGDDWIHLKA